ncbi:hypothetical protein CBO05C_2024 [Clostridium botulinum B str. Osaka05]|uniref:Uncharacterized protein n=1 Tax=Clostridium botulinum B str. Osaka05 TaxID=1407017 RepID=A0A0S6U1R8_CLOBO|nr:hypothetical protein [Clostridium botulinum]GAE02334.1 hypothetical protein CBO05C_2024 [Clostridium botulinum B str. Osaka05]
MKIYEGLGLQEEYNIINTYYDIKEIDYNNNEEYKKLLMQQLDGCISKESYMLKTTLRVSLELFLFYLEQMDDDSNKFIEVINNSDYRIVKGNQEIVFQNISLNKSLNSPNDMVDKNNIMNSCMKRYQDLIENASKHLSLFMEMINVKSKTFNDRDLKNTLYKKMNKLEKYESLQWALTLINRGLRNKIGHFDAFYDFKNCVFRDDKKNIICTYSEFHQDNLNIGAFEYGFNASFEYLVLLSMNEFEFLEEYISKVREYIGV